MGIELKFLLSWKPIPQYELFQCDEPRYCPESVSWSKKNDFSVYRKCPNFSMRLRLRTRGKLLLANFRLKIRAVWDYDIEKRSSNFSHKEKASGGNNLHQSWKRNASEICRNQQNYANFGNQIANFSFQTKKRRNLGASIVLMSMKFRRKEFRSTNRNFVSAKRNIVLTKRNFASTKRNFVQVGRNFVF